MILKETREKGGTGKWRKVLILKCDECGIKFRRHINVKAMTKRSVHFCSLDCAHKARKSGGTIDKRRKATNLKRYGIEYVIADSEIAKAGSLVGNHDPEAKRKRRESTKKRWKKKPWASRAKRSTVSFRGTKIICDSSFESRVIRHLAKNKEVVSITRCNDWIPYVLNETSKQYNPDFRVELKDGSIFILEIKGTYWGIDEVKLKQSAAKSFYNNRPETYHLSQGVRQAKNKVQFNLPKSLGGTVVL